MKQPQHASPLDVTIQWTEHDIPHIKASSYRALGYGYGYAHAHDRLAELSAQAIALRGERSKYFGAERSSTIGFLTTTNLNSDLMYRLRLPQHWVNQAWLQLSKDARDYLQGYVEGLNEYASQLSEYDKSQLFSEEPLVRFHTDDVIRATMRFGIMKELIEIGPHLVTTSNFWQQQSAANEPSPHSQPVGIEGGFGSNGWAFGGDVTENQSAILLANPHSAWKRTPHQQRIYMHQYHLTIPGELDVAGSSFLGFPLPMTGYNADVSWTILDAATVTAFVMQRMQIEPNSAQPTYQLGGQTKPLQFKNIRIEVLTEAGDLETQCFTFAFSELGPLYHLPERPNKPQGWYAITNAGEQNAKGIDQFLAVAKSTSSQGFVDAIENHRGILCQLLAADRYGEVAYCVAGNVLAASDEQLAHCRINGDAVAFNVLDGSKNESRFRDNKGVPLKADKDFYPNVISRGIIHNTNNSYKFTEWGVEQRDFAAVFGQHKAEHSAGKHIAAGLRYDPRLVMSHKRIGELQRTGKINSQQALTLLFDNRNYAAETFLDELLKLNKEDRSQTAQQALAVLQRWDRKNNSESKGALLFNQFWNRVIEARLLQVPVNGDPSLGTSLTLNEATEATILSALEDAFTQLQQLGIEPDTAWGKALKQQADNAWVPLHGGSYQEGILNGEMPAELTRDGFSHILFGSAYIQLSEWQNDRLQIAALLSHGQSENTNRRNKHKAVWQFSEKKLSPVPFHPDQLAQARVSHSLPLHYLPQ